MPTTNRRQFLRQAAAAATALHAPTLTAATETTTSPKLKLGFDNFSIRAFGWKAGQLLDYAAEQKVDALLISDLDSYDSFDPAYLKDIGQKAKDLGIELHAGTLSLCPTSVRFDKKRGTAEEHAVLLAKVAHGLGTSVARCVLGFSEDRKTEGGIRSRMRDMAKVLRAVKKEAQDLGVKFAVENHAGDMQGWELKDLIEDAGSDFVGATVDSGNATWTLEDPLICLETLAPYVLSSGIRDSMVWEDENGAVVQWTAMGEGCVDFKPYFAAWARSIPDKPVILETISGFSRPFPYRKADFWGPYREIRAMEFARFLELSKRGKPIPPFQPKEGEDRKKAEQEYQKAELERSLAFCRKELGLGRKA